MRKLLDGIVKFRRDVRPGMHAKFARLALGQSPDAMLIACSDSRVAPNVFASTDPGDLFVTRNVGNIVPPHGVDDGETAAVEFAVRVLGVEDIVVCGHSHCGAMGALAAGRTTAKTPGFKGWLKHAEAARAVLRRQPALGRGLPEADRLSQANVLAQLEHLKTFPSVRRALAAGRLRLHGWWFHLERAEVDAYEPGLGRFVPVDEAEAARIKAGLPAPASPRARRRR
ncbi:carbonic anhydrase [bacterium]|nr:MAG: carbonic anhydrase [bacterium]